MTAAGALLAAYDRQIRARITTAEIAGGRADRSGPLIRKIYPTDFASLWGGSTLPRWRRQGIYRNRRLAGWPRNAASGASRWTRPTTARRS